MIRRCSGFTLIELITVITLVAIVAAMGIPRFVSTSDFTERGYAEEALSAVQFARTLATASGCDTQVDFSSAGYSVSQWAPGSCTATGASPTVVTGPNGNALSGAAPSGMSIGSASFYFDRIGRPRSGGTLLTSATTITVGARQISIEPETGFVSLL
jgi:prepilin-type N-terminal cleavage/methylation domain-containing protein